jgi:autotransporter passenger strand-loop-strand repeat protein
MAYIISSGETSNGIILNNDSMTVLDSGIANNTTANRYGSMFISSGGTANSTTLNSDSWMYVSGGGTANSTTVNSYGRLTVSSGGTANSTILNSYGRLIVSSGGTANSTTTNSYYGEVYICSGGTANITTVNSGGVLVLSNGGTANDATVNCGGRIYVSYGGTLTEIKENGGYIEVANGADVTFVPNTMNELLLENASATIHSGTTAINTTIKSMGCMYVSDGGITNSTTVKNGGGMLVSSGGTANDIIMSGGSLTIYSGGTANNIVWAPCVGRVYVSDGAMATFVSSDYSGVYYGSDDQLLSHDVSMTGKEVNSNGQLYIISGGTSIDATINDYGDFTVSCGAASGTIMNGGWGYIYSGGVANDTIINGRSRLFLYFGGMASKTTVNAVGMLDVSSGGFADSTNIKSNGSLTIFSSGSANNTIVDSGGYLIVSSGIVNSTTVNANGGLQGYGGCIINSINVKSGGRINVLAASMITGKMLFESGAQVHVSAGSIINFDLTQTSIGAAALLNDHSVLIGAPSYTLTVNGTPDTGMYTLADRVSVFTGVIAVMNTTGEQLGSLLVGQKLKIDDTEYTLNVINGSLTVTVTPVDSIPPEMPVATADITTPTNGEVLVTAEFSEDSVICEYSLNGKNWSTYPGGVLFGSNRKVYFRGIDAAGNISEVAEYEVTNIDRTAPNKPSVSVDVTTPTNRGVTVSAKFDEDSSTKEYSFDGEDWLTYTDAILCAKNETVSFRGIDEAGNVSEVVSIEVNNIDSEAPSDPAGLKAYVVDQSVVLLWNASTDNSGVKEYVVKYTLDGEVFTVRTSGTNYVLNNADVGSYSWSVQAVDFAGNESAMTAGEAFTVSSSVSPAFQPYTIEYSSDNFEHTIRLTVTTPALNTFRLPGGTYQMRVKQAGSSEWAAGDPLIAEEFDDAPQLIQSDADGNADVFFVNAAGTWESGYVAQHFGSVDDWSGTQEQATLFGKNKLVDIIEGSTDANVLLMTDDENGDALFVDDIYSDSPNKLGLSQSRIAQIDEIRAGAGDDIVDMTSQRFEYVGDGLTIRGGEGNDVIWANKGDNRLFGDAGNDRIVGASGNDVIAGGIGNDRLHGGGGNDVFTFCDNWGADTVEQLETGSITLWFASGDKTKWDADTLTYSDGDNRVKVSGVTAEQVTLRFGNDGSDQFAALSGMGAFFDSTSERIFEESGKGMLATQSVL